MAIRRASHCVYDTRYHLVWAPKYRKWVLQGAVRERVRELFGEIAEHHGFEIEELEVDKDHVHVFLSFPPKYSIGQVVGLLRAVSAREIRAGFPEVRQQLWGGEFWEDGYFVRTVGDKVTADVIKKYIRFHEAKKRGVTNWASSKKPRPEGRGSLLVPPAAMRSSGSGPGLSAGKSRSIPMEPSLNSPAIPARGLVRMRLKARSR